MRYGTFKYGTGVLYGATDTATLPALVWSIEVDWDGDGVYTGENEAERATGLNCQRGRRGVLQGESIQHYQPGRLTVVLDNSDGRFDYFNASSPLYPNVSPGKFIKVRVLDVATATTYDVFRGITTEVSPMRESGIKKIMLTATDGLQFLAGQIIKTNIHINQDYDDLAAVVLAEAGWPTTQWVTVINRTTKVLTWWWAWGKDALSAVNDLADAALGVFYHTKAGTGLFFGANDSFISATIDLDEAEVLRDISVNMPWDTIRNEIIVKVYRKYSIANTDTLLHLTDDNDISVPNGTTAFFEAAFEPDPGLAGEASLETAARILTYENPTDVFQDVAQYLDDTEGAGGVQISAFNFQVHKVSSSVLFSVNNNSGTDGFFSTEMAPSTVINILNPVTITAADATSQAAYGKRTLRIDVRDVASTVYAQEMADYLLGIYKDPQVYPVVKIQGRPQKQFQPDLFTYRFNFTAPLIGISAAELFRVGGIEHAWLNSNGNSTVTTFWLEPYNALFSFT